MHNVIKVFNQKVKYNIVDVFQLGGDRRVEETEGGLDSDRRVGD